jgi:phage/plasmid primase-like uncharacterized protein
MNNNIEQIKSKAAGNWKSILMDFGIPEEILTSKEGRCFHCGGKTRARWIPEKQYYFCSHCEAKSRNGFQMMRDYLGMTFPEVIEKLSAYFGISDKPLTQAEKNKYKKQKRTKQYIRSKTIMGCALGSLKKGRKLTDDDIDLWDKAIRYIRFYDKTYPCVAGD